VLDQETKHNHSAVIVHEKNGDFAKGHPKIGGRKKGSKPKYITFREQLINAKFDISVEARKLYRWCLEHKRPDIAVRVLEMCAEYSIAKPRENQDHTTAFFVSANPYLQMPEAELIESYRALPGNDQCGRNLIPETVTR
jgi:hypothetical protein